MSEPVLKSSHDLPPMSAEPEQPEWRTLVAEIEDLPLRTSRIDVGNDHRLSDLEHARMCALAQALRDACQPQAESDLCGTEYAQAAREAVVWLRGEGCKSTCATYGVDHLRVLLAIHQVWRLRALSRAQRKAQR